MDKKKERSKPSSTSGRSYGLLRSIINLSSSSKPNSSLQNAQLVTIPDASPKEIYVSSKRRGKLKKRGSNESPSSCSSISNRERTSPSTLIGLAPRTFSILTALNELEVSGVKSYNVIPRPRSLSPPVSKLSNHLSSSINNWNQTSSSTSTTDTLQNVFPEPSGSRKKLGRPVWGKVACNFSSKLGEGPQKNEQNRSFEEDSTPEWIWKIFQLAKHGKLQDLQTSLEGLDPNLIRHLVDASGNTLLHCAARGGHLSTIQCLISVLGPHAEEALNDHNRAGRNVLLSALKGGRLECFQWLVLNTKTGSSALVPKNGERSLIHFAALYGNEMVVRWLSQLLLKNDINVDLRDGLGYTPLHLSAKSGYVLVCHELVLAGADVICQAEMGQRPVDLAVRHRRMECVDYLMMAETAFSVGMKFHGIVKEFQALQHKHEGLRSHFRELLRIGKWLVKERTELIKNFPSSDASILLGGMNSNGTRFSELEHKLEQIEQGWKNLHENKISEFSGNHLEDDSSCQFLGVLAQVQSRCRKGLLCRTSSSEEDDEIYLSGASSCDNADSGDSRDHTIYLQLPQTRSTYLVEHQYPYKHLNNPRGESVRSTLAPWLPPNDTLLAQLSPFVSQLDLIERAPTTPLLSNQSSRTFDALQNSVETKSIHSQIPENTFFHEHHTQPSERSQSKGPDTTLVLEVIEPGSKPIKEGCLTPDLIRKTKRGTAAVISKTFPSDGECLQGARQSDETVSNVYPEIKASFNSIKSHSTFVDEVASSTTNGIPFLQKQEETSGSLSQKCQKQIRWMHLNSQPDYLNAPVSSPSLPLGHGKQDEIKFKSKSNSSSNPYFQSSDGEFNVSILSNQITPSNHTSKLTVLPITSTSSPVTFPLLTCVEFSAWPGESDNVILACGTSNHLPPDSVSTSNTPVMTRSFSSVSGSSSAVLFPVRKGSWVSPDFPSLSATESSLLGRLSPSPSEASRTESALAPPPSNASHASHNSETSKTESARESQTTAIDMRRPAQEYNEERQRKTEDQIDYQSLFQIVRADQNNSEETYNAYLGSPSERNIKSQKDDEESTKISSLGSIPSSNIHSAPSSCMIQPLVSPGIHKATIQRVTKNGRGLSKPWYEVEASDEDEKNLIRKPRSSTSSKLSTSSLSNSESENESKTSDVQEF